MKDGERGFMKHRLESHRRAVQVRVVGYEVEGVIFDTVAEAHAAIANARQIDPGFKTTVTEVVEDA